MDQTTGQPNKRNIAAQVALSGLPANTPDAYATADEAYADLKVYDEMSVCATPRL